MQSVLLVCQGSPMGEVACARFIAAFVRANTRLRPVPHVPEILRHVADATVPLWRKTEPALAAMGLPAPFWAVAWAGGQALARVARDLEDGDSRHTAVWMLA